MYIQYVHIVVMVFKRRRGQYLWTELSIFLSFIVLALTTSQDKVITIALAIALQAKLAYPLLILMAIENYMFLTDSIVQVVGL